MSFLFQYRNSIGCPSIYYFIYQHPSCSPSCSSSLAHFFLFRPSPGYPRSIMFLSLQVISGSKFYKQKQFVYFLIQICLLYLWNRIELYGLICLLQFYRMDLLSKSSGTQDGQKEFSPLRVTNATSAFKSTGRNTGANWANRINKDVNDLAYDVSFSQFKGKAGSPHQFRMKTKLGRKNCGNRKEEKLFDKHIFRLQLMQMNKVANPQKLQITEQEKYSTIETQGLCKFQFDKTIAGRLKNRGHKHLDFRNQTTRQILLNSESEERGFAKSEQKLDHFTKKMFVIKKQNMQLSRSPRNIRSNNCHDFQSYSARRVFEPRQELDKIYDTQHYFRVIRANRTKETAKMEGQMSRKEQRPRESSTLSYEEYESKNFVMKSPRSHQVSRSPRRISFSKEVISAERGCYR